MQTPISVCLRDNIVFCTSMQQLWEELMAWGARYTQSELGEGDMGGKKRVKIAPNEMQYGQKTILRPEKNTDWEQRRLINP